MKAVDPKPDRTTPTPVGGVYVPSFRIIWKRSRGAGLVQPTRGELNAWLTKNWGAADAHAATSTRRLIGRDSL